LEADGAIGAPLQFHPTDAPRTTLGEALPRDGDGEAALRCAVRRFMGLGGTSVDYREAFAHAEHAHGLRQPGSASLLASCYEQRDGGLRDPGRALDLLHSSQAEDVFSVRSLSPRFD